ncbi:MAG TPA: alanine--tRNA ligase [Clostridia bacterium]|nr:alanine--tRNA ligase [Clostridia bacterium]
MEWTGLNELREKFLSYFESKGHIRLPSFPLVPQDDNTLLLINAGMAPMKKYFLGQQTPPGKRVVTCQKCIRTPDIERVGKTARHGTFFEMLGNFSFGDYFKSEATAWGWEFITKVLELPEDRLWVSIYESDDEAFEIWTKEVGVKPERIVRFGKEDNFWEHGTLPCGPCSEIYFDRGEKYGCGRPECAVGCDCDRYVEFWNIVFQQFDSDGKGHYTPLKKPNIDTGMGLERLACVLQDVNNLFEVDTIANIMKHVIRIAGVSYGANPKQDVSLRVITDHIRGTVFMVADGVIPSNEGRGYVLRRLIRRAARHGRLLGISGAFLTDICDTVIRENSSAYPELNEKKDYIKRVISMEEERFSTTIDQGLQLLNAMIEKMERNQQTVLSGADAFRLYDTFGFPLDLTSEILSERSMRADEDGFQSLMKEQRERARAARNAGGDGPVEEIDDDEIPDTVFVGYKTLECDAKIAGIFAHGEKAGFAGEGEKISVILDQTPFYAESGGQVGDSGVLKTENAVVRITGCKKTPSGRHIHSGVVLTGRITIGDSVKANVDESRRSAIARDHSVAHLLQASLRKVLGSHVQQAGQLVDEHRVRFDFTHFSALTGEELVRVEGMVNEAILSALTVSVTEMPIAEAKKTGALALFGEKYGSVVRVVDMGSVSTEFCGGTHVKNTAQIGLFKIVSESSVAAGVRRIEGATGLNLLDLLNNDGKLINETAAVLKSTPGELSRKAGQLVAELRVKEREIDSLNRKMAEMQLDGLMKDAKEIKGFKVISASFPGAAPDALRLITDRIREMEPNSVSVLAGVQEGKINFVAACGKAAVDKGAHAGKIIKQVAAAAGGGGGGRPDSATAGGKDVSRVGDALNLVSKLVEELAG